MNRFFDWTRFKQLNLCRVVILVILNCMILLTGCSAEPKTVVLTAGFAKDEVFRIENEVCYLPEALVYLTNIKNSYVAVYGPDILTVNSNGVALSDSIKDNALADISQIKAMNIEAKKLNMSLDDDEISKVVEAKNDYYASLSSTEIEYLGITEESLYQMYYEYALACKYYNELIKDINPEISDDEARTITVQHIFLKTYSISDDGTRVDFTPSEKEQVRTRAGMIRNQAVDGEHDFEELVYEYTEGSTDEYSFSLEEAEPTFGTAAFNLGKNEISPVIESQYGFHIIKCVSTFNLDETAANKLRITEEKKEEVFGREFEAKVENFITEMNDELWNSISLTYDEDVNTQSFFEIYHKYFD